MKENETLYSASCDLRSAMNDLILAIAYGLKIDKLANWLNKKLRSIQS